MSDVPDYPLEQTLDFKFTSRAFATGIPTTLASPTVVVFEDNGTTEITVGETVSADFDGVTGLNNLRIVATAANGYESGKSYQAVLTVGTVGGVSVVGEVVAQFSIERSPALRPATAGRTALVSAAGGIAPDWANVEAPTSTVGLTNTTVGVVSQVAGLGTDVIDAASLATDAVNEIRNAITGGTWSLNTTSLGNIGIDWANVQNPATAVDLSQTDIQLVDTVTTVTNTVNANAVSAIAAFFQDCFTVDSGEVSGAEVSGSLILETAKVVWDRVLTGATHNLATSAGRRLRGIQDFQGYEDGAIWIDTINGSAGTTDFENGTVENPVNTIADANTLAASLGIARFRILPASTLDFSVPGADQENQEFLGNRWTLALGGRSISGSFFQGADVSGIGTGATEMHFDHCHFAAVTLPPCDCEGCILEGTFTFGTAGDFFFENCKSGVAGTGTPALNYGAALNSSNVNFRLYSGGIEIQNMGAGTGGYNMSLEGHGQLVVNANCSATSAVAIRGHFPITGDSTAIAAITFSDDARFTRSEVVDDVWDEVISTSAHNTAQSAGKRLRQITSVIIANDTAEVGNSPAINQIQLAAGESAVDGTFDPGIVGIIDGTGVGQCRLILEYDGTSKLATLNRDWKVAPDATSEYIILCSEGGMHVNEGLAQGGGASSITLNSLASLTNDVYNGQMVFLVSGLGQDQVGRVTAYNGTTKVATIETTQNGWATQPDATTGYIMIPIIDISPSVIGTPIALDSGTATIAGMLTKMADDNAGADFDAGTDSLQEIRDRVDAVPTAVENADALLIRDVSNVEDTAATHSLCTIVLATLESSISSTTWTIRKTGGTTFTTKTITVDASADPITGVT